MPTWLDDTYSNMCLKAWRHLSSSIRKKIIIKKWTPLKLNEKQMSKNKGSPYAWNLKGISRRDKPIMLVKTPRMLLYEFILRPWRYTNPWCSNFCLDSLFEFGRVDADLFSIGLMCITVLFISFHCVLSFLKVTWEKKMPHRRFLTMWEDFCTRHLRSESGGIQDETKKTPGSKKKMWIHENPERVCIKIIFLARYNRVIMVSLAVSSYYISEYLKF